MYLKELAYIQSQLKISLAFQTLSMYVIRGQTIADLVDIKEKYRPWYIISI